MPVLEEHPAALIRATSLNFSIAPDKASLSRLSTSLAHLTQTRAAQHTTSSSALKRLARALHTQQQQQQQNHGDGAEAHAAQILALDTRKFRVAKECGALEADGARLEAEVARAEAVLSALERGLEHEHEHEQQRPGREADVLRLKVYRSLGVDLEGVGGGEGNGGVVRAVARGGAGVVDVFDVREGDEGVLGDRVWEGV